MASRAVDGNTDGNYWNNSVTHTLDEYQPWWRVDLASEMPIHEIVLFNRTDCCWDRLSNFHVSIFDAGMNEVFRRDFFTTVTNPSSDRIPIQVGGVVGRYIQVQLNGAVPARPLSLAEVVVNGTPQTPQTLPMTGISSFAIGSAIGTEFWPGRIDDFAIWNEVLSDAEIAALATRAVVISSSSIQSSVTNTGGMLNPGGQGVIGSTTFASGNLALQSRGSTASQSSTAYSAPATRAIDGNTDGNFWNGSVTHTDDEYQPWWRVDLGTPATLMTITLWNRTDCCSDRLSDFRVSVFDDAMTEVWGQDYFTTGGYPNPSFSITLPPNVVGRYVQVQLRGAVPARPLSLAEVQVEGGLNYTQAGDGVLVIDVDAASGTADKLIVPGTLTLGGTLRLNLLSGEPAIGSRFDILDWGVLVGRFDRLDLPPFSRPGIFWDTSRLYTEGILSVGVPEPGSVTLLLLGIVGLILRRVCSVCQPK